MVADDGITGVNGGKCPALIGYNSVNLPSLR